MWTRLEGGLVALRNLARAAWGPAVFLREESVVKQPGWSGVYAAFEKCSGHLCGRWAAWPVCWARWDQQCKCFSFESHTHTASFCATSLPPPDISGLREGPPAPTLTSLDSRARPESTLVRCPLG